MLTSSIITYITIHLIHSIITYNFIYSFDTISFYKSLYDVFRYKPSIDIISILFNVFNCKIKLKLENSRVLS